MEIRKTKIEELDKVMAIYAHARQFMAETGNPNQWGNIKPHREWIVADIEKGNSYVCVEKDGKFGIFAPDGSELFPIECDKIDCDEKSPLFRYDVVMARLEGQRIRIDKSGNPIYQYSLISE